ncbi:MAG: DUF4276 family protein [Spirochaetales bacterium]|jgi:hypothetical protein|nr:DUF4276 family protein [Spirochaetales bacterium]
MRKFVFLLEEQSMKEVLEVILPRILPRNIVFQCIAHQGKSHLKKSIKNKLAGWKEPDVQFVIVHDQDCADCFALKEELHALANEARRPDTLIRIVCTELESWFLGDFNAIEKGFHASLATKRRKAFFRNPDSLPNAKQELRKLIPMYQQITGSREIAQYMDIAANTSSSFKAFIKGVRRLCGDTAGDVYA